MPAPVLTPQSDARLTLPQVTLVAATSVAPEATARAVVQSMADIAFGDVLWISDLPPPQSIEGPVRWEAIARLDSREAYSRCILHDLPRMVHNDFVLCIQWDGYVLDPALWNPDFLNYDYIGAVWPQFTECNVGNGGFSLRSRRLLEICSQLPGSGDEAEDLFICRTMRAQLEADHAIRFAPAQVAARFAYERQRPRGSTFGFHGIFNLVELVSDREAAALIGELPAHGLARNELRELLAWSVRRARPQVALEIARRWRRWL